MRLNKSEREEFRKRVKILIPQMEKSEIVNHFQKEGCPRQTIYNRKQLGSYYSNDKSKCADSVRFAGKEKYPNKAMVWVAICNRGISKPLFRPLKSEAVDSDIYINECLEKRLLPFIREHHPDSNYIFWHDLASCHYSKQTIAWMDECQIRVQRD